ncbi:MAG: tetratricopeptide repeat protein [Dyella sp.]
MHKLWLVGMLALVSSGAAFAGDSPQEVQAALQQGNYPMAEREMRQAISEHPQSAKAHYVLAQVLAHEGNIGDAAKEANQAQQLDPRLSFTDPARFQRFQAELHQALTPIAARGAVAERITHPMVQVEHRHFHMLWLILGLLVIVGLFMMFRRNRQNAPSGYDQRGYAPPQAGVPNGYGAAYPPPAPPYPQQPTAGSGLGGAFVGGLAGGVLGAAAVEMFENHERRVEQDGFGGSQPFGGQPGGFPNNDPQGQAYDDLRSSPIDMGNDDSGWGGGDSFDTGDDSWS